MAQAIQSCSEYYEKITQVGNEASGFLDSLTACPLLTEVQTHRIQDYINSLDTLNQTIDQHLAIGQHLLNEQERLANTTDQLVGPAVDVNDLADPNCWLSDSDNKEESQHYQDIKDFIIKDLNLDCIATVHSDLCGESIEVDLADTFEDISIAGLTGEIDPALIQPILPTPHLSDLEQLVHDHRYHQSNSTQGHHQQRRRTRGHTKAWYQKRTSKYFAV